MSPCHQWRKRPPRAAVLIATLGLVAGSLVFASASALAEPLPDGRVYEMVTPVANDDADVYVPLGLHAELVNNAGEFDTRLPFQVANNGEAIAFVGAPTVGGNGNSGLGNGDEYFSKRLPQGGWEVPVNLQPTGQGKAAINSAFYQAFSPTLALGILQAGSYQEPDAPLLAPQAPGNGYSVLYTRQPNSETYHPLFTTEPSNRNAATFETFGAPLSSRFAPHEISYAGSSVNSERLLFEANGAFQETKEVNGNLDDNNLYESVGGRLSLVNILPDGMGETNATFGAGPLSQAAHPPADFSNVISEDGSRIFWTDLAPGTYENHIFLRENPSQPESPHNGAGECTVSSDACTVPVSAGPARYWAASTDGRYVIYTEEGALYRFDTLLSEREALTERSAEVQGVVGASDDATYLYFVARGVLASNKNSEGTEAIAGEDNLYMLREGAQPVFVATLSSMDGNEAIEPLANQLGEVGDWTPGLGNRTAEVTPDGGSLVFMSNNQMVDGHYEEAGGEKLEEVYVYDAGTGGLWCASCGGERGIKPQVTRESKHGLGAFVPVSNQFTYQPTVISADGSRVFFDSAEPLVSGDTNGELDVYEWDREGTNGCGVKGGCVYLLSGGDASTSSWLIGGDESGDNVFFVTRAQLAPEDENENYDLYDARVDGLQRVSPPACSGTGCQGVPASAPTFATPSSVTFEGVGNFPPPAETTAPVVKPKPKAKPKLRARRCKGGFVKRNGRCVKRAARSRKGAKGFVRRHVSLWKEPSPGAKFSTKGNYAAGAVLG